MKQPISRLSLSDPLLKLCLLLKLTESKASAFAFFPDDAISFAMDQYSTTHDIKKDPSGWCFEKARNYCHVHNIKPDWVLYKSITSRYASSNVAAGGWSKMENPSNGRGVDSAAHGQKALEHQANIDAYKLRCEERSLEYMQRPGSKEKAVAYGRFGFLADMQPTESLNLSYEEMSTNYITAQMVKFATIPQSDSNFELPQINQSRPSVVENVSSFEDGQPLLDDIPDDIIPPTIFTPNSSPYPTPIGNLLRESGLFN